MTFILNDTARARFWVKVRTTAGCWEWTARRDDEGYGRFRPDGANTGDVGAHRVAWAVGTGVCPPDDLLVCHTCDNPPCVRFSHLFLGTPKNNTDDSVAKGRWATGDRNGRRLHPERYPPQIIGRAHGVANAAARLDDVRVRDIRAAYAAGETQSSIALRENVTQVTISRVVSGKTWKHVH